MVDGRRLQPQSVAGKESHHRELADVLSGLVGDFRQHGVGVGSSRGEGAGRLSQSGRAGTEGRLFVLARRHVLTDDQDEERTTVCITDDGCRLLHPDGGSVLAHVAFLCPRRTRRRGRRR